MVEVICRERKSPILTPSSIPCLRQLPTINITQGCTLGCIYCYIQGYSHYPGPDRITLFANTADVLSQELRRKRHLPQRVYFSASSDAFQDLPEVQDVTFQTMSVLLEAGVEISFLTKGFVTQRFLDLFAANSSRVYAQIGITSLDRELWKGLEPYSALPDERLETIVNLIRTGVQVTARLDPLIPDVSDTEESLKPLLLGLREAGVTRAAASYLFMRPPFAKALASKLIQLLDGRISPDAWPCHHFVKGCGGGRMISLEERTTRFRRLAELGKRFGIEIMPCRCKNPDLGSQGCQIAGPTQTTKQPATMQEPLLWSEPE